MISEEDFVKNESMAPLLNLNAGFLTLGEANDVAVTRAAKWTELAGVDMSRAISFQEEADHVYEEAGAALRIYIGDARRTFQSEAYRKRMIQLLQAIGDHIGDYHQGLGYTASFLMLTGPKESVLRLLMHMWDNDKFIPGYWKGAPDNFARDAMVYERLALQFFPEVAQHLRKAGVVPEAYTQKWFCGLCIQVLPYKALFDYFDAFFELGHIFLFQFAMTVLRKIGDRVLATDAIKVNELFSLVRLEVSYNADKTAGMPDMLDNLDWYVDLVAEAREFDLSGVDIAKLRGEEMETLQKKQAEVRAREERMKAEEESDDEIVFSDEEDD